MTKKEVPEPMLMNHLDELAAFEPAGYPFISLYLDLQPDQHGRDNFARQTGARVIFIEDTALLSSVGGVGAMLRYRI